VIADAAGDLLGETGGGGAANVGTVYEIAKTEAGYADTPTTLVSFDLADGGLPQGGLILDAEGNLFGTTSNGGAGRHGTVFEIARTQGGYAGAPSILFNFKNGRGRYPSGALIADAAGDLFGTTDLGGANGDGTVFEIKHSGFATSSDPLTSTDAGVTRRASPGAAFVQAMASHGAGGLAGNSRAIFASPHETRTLLAPPNIP
jgi:uncharacterized repeat protein (TIGR03803 family)